MDDASRTPLSRRRLLAVLALAPAVGACSFGPTEPPVPDPLIALADAARADAVLATAAGAVVAPELVGTVEQLAAARTEHAVALEAEIRRLDPERPTATPAPTTTPAAPDSDPFALLRAAVAQSSEGAAGSALDLPAERVGLVASVAACCSAYATALG